MIYDRYGKDVLGKYHQQAGGQIRINGMPIGYFSKPIYIRKLQDKKRIL